MSEPVPSFQVANVSRRADAARSEIEAAGHRLTALQDRQRALLREFSSAQQSGQHDTRLREVGRELKAAQDELEALHQRLAMAHELDAEEGMSAAVDDFEVNLRVAMKHLLSRGKLARQLAQGMALVTEALAGYQEANDAALRHLQDAARHLPRRQRIDLVHAVRRYITGSHNITALVQGLAAAGVGRTGIEGGVIIEPADGRADPETFESALDKCNQIVHGQLGKWLQIARGDAAQPLIVEVPQQEPSAPLPPREIKWADETKFGAGGQAPHRREYNPHG